MAFHSAAHARLFSSYRRSPYSAPATTEILWFLLLISPVAMWAEIEVDIPIRLDAFLVAFKFLLTEYGHTGTSTENTKAP